MADHDPAPVPPPDPIPSAEPPLPADPPQPARAARRPRDWVNALSKAERDQLVTASLALAKYLARYYARSDPYTDRDDLYGEALLCLTESARRWDPAAGTEFVDFAANYCRRRLAGRVVDGFRRHGQRLTRSASVSRVADHRGEGEDEPGQVPEAAAAFGRAVLGLGWGPELDALTPTQRELVRLLVADRLDPDQAAAAMGWPAKTARMAVVTIARKLAAAGHVPDALARAVGLDATALARAGNPHTAAADRVARRAAVAARPGASVRELAAALNCSPECIDRDRAALARAAAAGPTPNPSCPPSAVSRQPADTPRSREDAMSPAVNPSFVGTGEAARRIGCDPQHLRRAEARGQIAPLPRASGARVLAVAELPAIAEALTRAGYPLRQAVAADHA